jgi:Transposase DDE domain
MLHMVEEITKLPASQAVQELEILSKCEVNLEQEFVDFKRRSGGRKRKLNLDQIVEALRMKSEFNIETWLGLYKVILKLTDWEAPTYANFLNTIKTTIYFLIYQINRVLLINNYEFNLRNDKIAFVDSTPLTVCKVIRSSRHKTMKDLAEYSKSSTGYYYGLKLHCISDYQTDRVLDIDFSKAKLDDRKYLSAKMKGKYLNSQTMFVGDKGYQAKWLEDEAKATDNYLVTGKKTTVNQKTLATKFDIFLLHNRAKIETLFSLLKCNYFMTSTRSRSVLGYVFVYIFSIFSLVLGQK